MESDHTIDKLLEDISVDACREKIKKKKAQVGEIDLDRPLDLVVMGSC